MYVSVCWIYNNHIYEISVTMTDFCLWLFVVCSGLCIGQHHYYQADVNRCHSQGKDFKTVVMIQYSEKTLNPTPSVWQVQMTTLK